jgi:hypothetical protein
MKSTRESPASSPVIAESVAAAIDDMCLNSRISRAAKKAPIPYILISQANTRAESIA